MELLGRSPNKGQQAVETLLALEKTLDLHREHVQNLEAQLLAESFPGLLHPADIISAGHWPAITHSVVSHRGLKQYARIPDLFVLASHLPPVRLHRCRTGRIHNVHRTLTVSEMRLRITRKLIAMASEPSCGDEFPRRARGAAESSAPLRSGGDAQ